MRVASSNITGVEYDENKHEMTVQFSKTGAIYVYSGVDKTTYESLLRAESPGGFLHSAVKPNFAVRRIA